MALSLKHKFVDNSTDSTGVAAESVGPGGVVGPNSWNSEHAFTMATARLLGRTTAGGGAVEELAAATAMTLLRGVSGFTAGGFSRVMTAASGNVAYTGVGFTPSGLLLFGVNPGLAQASIGFVDQSGAGRCIINYTGGLWTNNGQAIQIMDASSNQQAATLASYDSDGFTLSWVKGGSPTGTANIYYLAMR